MAKKKKKDNKKKQSSIQGATFEQNQRHARAFDATQDMTTRLNKTATQWRNSSKAQRAGRLAEEWHAGTFNVDAARKGMSSIAKTGASSAKSTADADIWISKGTKTQHAQVKFHGTAKKTARALVKKKYNRMQKVVPEEQLEQVKQYAKKRTKNPSHQDTVRNATDRLRHDGVESKALSRKEALNMAQDTQRAAQQALEKEIMNSAVNGAKAGAIAGGGLSAFFNAKDVIDGQKEWDDALFDTGKDTLVAAGKGCVANVGSVAVKEGLKRAGAQSIARSSASVAIAMGGVEIGINTVRLISGDMDGEEFMEESAKTAVTTATAWGGAEAGAAIGTALCPGAGTVVGGIIGGVVGGIFGGSLF